MSIHFRLAPRPRRPRPIGVRHVIYGTGHLQLVAGPMTVALALLLLPPLAFAQAAPSTLSGLVTGETGLRLADAGVVLYLEDGRVLEIPADSEGRFTFEVEGSSNFRSVMRDIGRCGPLAPHWVQGAVTTSRSCFWKGMPVRSSWSNCFLKIRFTCRRRGAGAPQ